MSARRIVDVMVSAIGLVLMLPLLLVVAVAVALAHGRPVLFRQHRVTTGGRLFSVAKFRTMLDLHDASGMPLPDSERMTGLGKALRRLRIDELPQLFNVLAGDMSLIGPRPLLAETLAAAGALGRKRCTIAPGMTGWAQVNGNARLADADKIALDVWYIDNRSVALDLEILLRTFQVTLVGERPNPLSVRRAHEGHPRRRG